MIKVYKLLILLQEKLRIFATFIVCFGSIVALLS